MKLFVIAALFLVVTNSLKTWQCNTATDCSNQSLDCGTDDCQVFCNVAQSCKNTEVICAADKTCDVSCNAEYSCGDITFDPNFPTNSKGPVVYCKVANSCSEANFNAINENFFTVTCQASHACEGTHVSCGTAQSCLFQCSGGKDTCVNTVFDCDGAKNLCYMRCNGGGDDCHAATQNCANVLSCLTQCDYDFSCTGVTQNCDDAHACSCWGIDGQHQCVGVHVNPGITNAQA
jgi:hypothetical protein